MILLASQSQWFAHKLNMFSDQREDQPKGYTRHKVIARIGVGGFKLQVQRGRHAQWAVRF